MTNGYLLKDIDVANSYYLKRDLLFTFENSEIQINTETLTFFVFQRSKYEHVL